SAILFSLSPPTVYILMTLFSFSSHSSGPPRALHSLPTRRSSDLLSKIEAGHVDVVREVVAVQPLLDECVATVRDYLRGREVQVRSEEHTSELQSRENLVCRLLLE